MRSALTLPSILITAIAIMYTLLLIAGVRFALQKSGTVASTVQTTTLALLIAACLWFTLTGVAAHQGFFSNFAA